MSLSNYEIISMIYIPYSLILWSIDYLSDKNITHNELEIGLMQYIHHLFGIFNIGVIILLLTSKSISLAIITILVNLFSQVGFLINNDDCWLLTLINNKINPTMPRRKWRGEMESLIKHYTRGDDWAYSEIRNNSATRTVLYVNILMIAHLVKLMLVKK